MLEKAEISFWAKNDRNQRESLFNKFVNSQQLIAKIVIAKAPCTLFWKGRGGRRGLRESTEAFPKIMVKERKRTSKKCEVRWRIKNQHWLWSHQEKKIMQKDAERKRRKRISKFWLWRFAGKWSLEILSRTAGGRQENISISLPILITFHRHLFSAAV